jgi:hypothetical protein
MKKCGTASPVTYNKQGGFFENEFFQLSSEVQTINPLKGGANNKQQKSDHYFYIPFRVNTIPF